MRAKCSLPRANECVCVCVKKKKATNKIFEPKKPCVVAAVAITVKGNLQHECLYVSVHCTFHDTTSKIEDYNGNNERAHTHTYI